MIAILPWKVDVPTNRTPWANWGVMLVTAVVSIWALCDDSLFYYLGAIEPPSLYIEHPNPPLHNPITGHKYSLLRITDFSKISERYLPLYVSAMTSTFLHTSIMHLCINLVMLWVFGNAVNYKLGQLGYLVFYILAAFASGVAQYAWLQSPSVGASGAAMAVIGCFIVYFPRNDVEIVLWVAVFKEPIGCIASYWMIVICVCIDTFMQLLGNPFNVGFIAHWSGAALGIAVGFGTLIAKWVVPARCEETLYDILLSRL